MGISVAMAVYNGEKYIKEQILSILKQLNCSDEIVISYDKSTDNTYRIISDLAVRDSRIKIFRGPSHGAIKNFENALLHCTNDYIFLSDQDDIWLDNKVSRVLSVFKNKHVDVVLHDCCVVNDKEDTIHPSFFKFRHCTPGFLFNLLHNSYIGCCMALKRDFLHQVLPFPEQIPMHDQWIGLIGEKKGKVAFIKSPLIKYRRHSNNASKLRHLTFKDMLRHRLNLICALFRHKKLS